MTYINMRFKQNNKDIIKITKFTQGKAIPPFIIKLF